MANTTKTTLNQSTVVEEKGRAALEWPTHSVMSTEAITESVGDAQRAHKLAAQQLLGVDLTDSFGDTTYPWPS